MRPALILVFSMLASQAAADAVYATRTIRANSVITAQDLVVKDGEISGMASAPEQLIGTEARVALYAGRPIALANVGPPALVERNQIVPLVFEKNGLTIMAEGRSLARAGEGDYVRVMNLSSRSTVSGVVMPDGRILVSR